MKAHKHHIVLLEVLIALAIVALCLLPLLSPHYEMLASEKRFMNKIVADKQANLAFAMIIEKLYKNEIPWEALTGQQTKPLPLENGGSFNLSYQFGMPKIKTENFQPRYLLVPLTITVAPKKEPPLLFSYEVFVEHGQTLQESETEEEGDEEE